MLTSLASITKTCYDLQKLDLTLYGIKPKAPIKLFLVSFPWFFSILSFRGVSIAVQCLYLNQFQEDLPLLPLVPISLILVSNSILSWWMLESSSYIQHGFMASVAPALFICTTEDRRTTHHEIRGDFSNSGLNQKSDDEDEEALAYISPSITDEHKTFKYIAANTLINSLIHLAGLAAVVDYLDPPFLDQEASSSSMILNNKKWIKAVAMPLVWALYVLSLACTLIYWSMVLDSLSGHQQVAHPEHVPFQSRLDTFDEVSTMETEFVEKRDLAMMLAPALARRGFFFISDKEDVCCYECGFKSELGVTRTDRDVNLYQIRLEHLARVMHSSTALPNVFKEHLTKILRQQPEDNVMGSLVLRTNWLFDDPATRVRWCALGLNEIIYFSRYHHRLKSFLGYESDFSDFELSEVEAARSGYVRGTSSYGFCFCCGKIIRWIYFSQLEDICKGHYNHCIFVKYGYNNQTSEC